MEYKYSKNVGALQEAAANPAAAAPPPASRSRASFSNIGTQSLALTQQRFEPPSPPPPPQAPRGGLAGGSGLDPIRNPGRYEMFFYTVEEGQKVLKISKSGKMDIIEGPARIWKGGARFQPMTHYMAHPGEFLMVRFRNGRQEHLPGPSHVWLDPREHLNVEKEDILQIASKEAVVVYSQKEGAVARRIVLGPAAFVPSPGEWLHTFSWHGSAGGEDGFRKVPNALVFQKLWLMPDQMYHDVPDVRTADDAVLTIRLMVFFELVDIERMLAATHDPIGDFVNAATSDVVEFVGRHDFDSFKNNTDKLNDLGVYKQLVARAQQCGYKIEKVVYRGYGAPASLQQMHDQAIESRTRLQLERATETQAQELEDFRQERQLARATKAREEKDLDAQHDLALRRRREQAELDAEQARRTFLREQAWLDAEQEERALRLKNGAQREHYGALGQLGVDLTSFLTQARADQVIELRGSGNGAQIHLESPK